MALIKCTECGKEFSDRAAACPNCGCPTDIILEDIEKEKSIQQKKIVASYVNITVRQSRQSGVARATCPD